MAIQSLLSGLYLGAVLLLSLISLWPRLTPQFTALHSDQPVQPASNPAQTPPSTSHSQPAGQAQGSPLSLNQASQTELESLPRVGPALAQRIIEGRPYRSVDDLLAVKGIGEKLLAQLRPLVQP